MSIHTTPVAEFHRAFGHPVEEKLTVGTSKLRALRVSLIAEELTELAEALGVQLSIDADGSGKHTVRIVDATNDDSRVDLIETADALGDLKYVVEGAALVFGIPLEPVFMEIHRSNMSKLGTDGKPIYREDGKVLKGPNYTPPNVAAVLAIERSPA